MATAVPVHLVSRSFGLPQTTWGFGSRAVELHMTVLAAAYNGAVNPMAGVGMSGTLPDATLITVTRNIGPGTVDTLDYPDTEEWRGINARFFWTDTVHGGFFDGFIAAPQFGTLSITRTGKVFAFTLTTNGFINTAYFSAPYPVPTFYADFGGVITSAVGIPYFNAHAATFTHDFTSPVAVRFEVVDGYGQRSAWLMLKLGPVCSFTVDDSANPVLEFDGRASFDPDGHITNWDWLINSVVETSGETAEYDASSHEGFNIAVNLQVTDNDGLMALCEFVRVPIESNVFHSSLVDAAGHTLVARNDGQNVIVEAFPSGAASRQVRSTITQAKNPSIWRDRSNNLYLLRTDRGSGNAVKTKSRDSGRSWS